MSGGVQGKEARIRFGNSQLAALWVCWGCGVPEVDIQQRARRRQIAFPSWQQMQLQTTSANSGNVMSFQPSLSWVDGAKLHWNPFCIPRCFPMAYLPDEDFKSLLAPAQITREGCASIPQTMRVVLSWTTPCCGKASSNSTPYA